MWTLVKEHGGGQVYHFLTATEYVVGRKNCAILVEDDQSISRVHAMFTVSHSLSNLAQPNIIPVLTIKDSSKYGTFVNGEKMQNGTSVNLISGDKITFGVYNSKFRVTYEPLVACSSCLNASEKNTLNQAVLALGGHVINSWTEKCTHLVMTSVKVTIKTICALICCRAIVKLEYFTDVKNSIQQKKPLPTLTSFMPAIDEPSLQAESVDLSENPKRKTIFKDKTFLFLTSKQYKKLSPAIHFGCGKATLLTRELDNQSLLENPNTCVIDVGMSESQLSESQSTPSWITSTMSVLRSKGLRTIPEAEIGLSVIYMSTEIYCNPLQRLMNRNEADKVKDNIEGSTLSLSMAVDETVLPPTTFNTTAYVANTEPQDQTLNCLEVSGVREVNETPRSNERGSKLIRSVRQDPEASMSGDCRTALFQERTAPSEKRSRQVSQTETSTCSKERNSQKAEPTNKIQNYFLPKAKKRDRNEDDECEMSSTKLARVEKSPSLCLKPTKNQISEKDADRPVTHVMDVDLDTEPVVASTDSFASDIMKKRKEPDHVVEESDLEEEEEEEIGSKRSANNVKRPRIQPQDDIGVNLKTESPARGDRSANFQNIKTKADIKLEPESQCEDTKILIKPKVEEDSEHPSKLLVLEFCSLVVSRPTRNTGNSNHGNGHNYKKFRKIAYPGAGSFPHIIGGSDLIAHDRKKNSELEQWLRQEMEEQSQQAREQSRAEDLFRYNPKMVKKRK